MRHATRWVCGIVLVAAASCAHARTGAATNHHVITQEEIVASNAATAYDVIARLSGGGVSGQAGALRLAIARALIEADAEDRPALKREGFLSRDPRVKERKKYGLKKARKAPQYSKR